MTSSKTNNRTATISYKTDNQIIVQVQMTAPPASNRQNTNKTKQVAKHTSKINSKDQTYQNLIRNYNE